MHNRFAALTVVAALLLVINNAFGQNVITARMDGQPLIYMKDGNLTGCGVRFIILDAVAQPSNAPVPLYDLSFNLHLPGHAVIKAVSNDVPSAEIKSGVLRGALKPKPLVSFWLRASEKPATKPLTRAMKGDDPGSLLYSSDLDSVLPLFAAQAAGETILVGVKREGAKSERVFRGTITLSEGKQSDVDQCLQEFIKLATK